MYEKKFVSRNFVENFRLLGPRSLMKNSRNLASLFNDQNGTNYLCGRDLALLEDALARKERWALKMWDASSKIPAGVLEGNVVDLGMFDECVKIKDVSQGVEIRGRHCMYSIASIDGKASLYTMPTPSVSICMPSTCDATDIIRLFNSTISAIGSSKDLGITVTSPMCTFADKDIWTTGSIICSSIFLAYIGALIFCTLVDVALRQCDAGEYDGHPVLSTLAKFSFFKSISSIFSRCNQDANLPALHGIRFFSMCWVVLGHEYTVRALGVLANVSDLINRFSSWNLMHIYMATFAVDTFNTMSGFLMTYTVFKQFSKEKSFNVYMYYLHRYVRLTPAVIAMLAISVSFGSKIGSGPRWNQTAGPLLESCQNKWWPHILYLQNFVDRENLCLAHLWYLAVDMQLFWISPIILLPLLRKPKLGWAILFAFFLASIAIPGVICGLEKHSSNVFYRNGTVQLSSHEFQNVYKMPYNRAGPWLVGIMLGFEVAKNNRKLGKFAVLVGWLVTVAAFSFCIYGTRSFIKSDYEYNVLWEAVFSAISRHVWAVGICWIIYACIYNHAGLISNILSWNIFLPFSRISYSIYLLHAGIVGMPVMTQRIPLYFSDIAIMRDFIADLVISIGGALLFTLLFESPIVTLEKIIFKRKCENAKESKKNLTSEGHKEKQN